MSRRSINLWVFGCLLSMAGMTHGETVKPPLIFHFSLLHSGKNFKCESESIGSSGYKAFTVGRNYIPRQSLQCVFFIEPEENEPLPTFCSLMGLDEKLSCSVERGERFWTVGLSSETHPIGGVCSVICQVE